jgi:hypothetical protein
MSSSVKDAVRTLVPEILLSSLGLATGTPPPQATRPPMAVSTKPLQSRWSCVDVNAAKTNGRTALDSAKTLKYDTVAKFLVDKGARTK